MQTFIGYLALFMIGSFMGWILEVFFRRFFSAKKWINPGFLTGPWLPLYGAGIVILYLIGLINISWWVQVIIITVTMTLIEYLTGLIFIKGMGIKLWDYSNMKGNIQGIICPLFTIIWGVIGTVFLFLLKDPIEVFLNTLVSSNLSYIFDFFIGIWFGILIVDVLHSINIANKIRSVVKVSKQTIVYEKFKSFVGNQREKKKNFIIPIKASENIKSNVSKFLTSLKDSLLINPKKDNNKETKK
ncbi:putative ABC transporter permease [Haploplasma axanthum]|uniref:Predicted membrane protein n=1 Tax=Haploplasma axanthum TaxID=29552 RepID=A0A449BDD8_HAPAX|nr:putative ABC transporter permease [Haploplasma axanthum]VEU80473.1 Predicted membrane protein [Haploplasma axanthum]